MVFYYCKFCFIILRKMKGDGLITYDEFKILVKEKGVLDWKVKHAFRLLDKNKDGKINFQGIFT